MSRAKINIRQRGVEAAVERLSAVGDAAFHQHKTFDDLAEDAPNAISKIPVRSGRLAASVKDGHPEQYKKVTPFGYEIGTTVWYGRFVFGGTKTMTPRKPRISRKRLQEAAAEKVAADVVRARRSRGFSL